MDEKGLAQRLLPLLDGAPRADRGWLRRLLLDPDSYKAYAGMESELFLKSETSSQSVLVTSAVQGEGRTAISLTLAAMACVTDRSQRTLLVDASLQDGRLGDMLGKTQEGPGLAEYFDDAAAFDACVRETALTNLFVLPRSGRVNGPIPFLPRAFRRLMESAVAAFDRIVVDGPPRSSGGHLLAMASSVRSAIVVVRYRGSTVEQIGNLIGELEPAGCRVLGCVLNRRIYPVPEFLYGRR